MSGGRSLGVVLLAVYWLIGGISGLLVGYQLVAASTQLSHNASYLDGAGLGGFLNAYVGGDAGDLASAGSAVGVVLAVVGTLSLVTAYGVWALLPWSVA